MTQRPATRLTSRVDRYVRRHFGTDADRAIAELNETVPGLPLSNRQNPERLAMAIVLLADGSYETLQARARDAMVDWRDVLVAAGLGDEDWRQVLNVALDEGYESVPPFGSRVEAGVFLVGWAMIAAGLVGMWFVPYLFYFVGVGFLMLEARWWYKWFHGRSGPWYTWPWGPIWEPHLARTYKAAWRYVTHTDLHQRTDHASD